MSAVYLEYIYLGLDLLIGCSGRSSPSDKGGGGGDMPVIQTQR